MAPHAYARTSEVTGGSCFRIPPIPRSRGQVISAREVAQLWPAEIRPSTRWVHENVPGKHRWEGCRPAWFEHDVWEWLRSPELLGRRVSSEEH